MRKALFTGIFLVYSSLALFAAGVTEEEITAEYAGKKYAARSDWLYEFNQIASQVHNDGLEVVKYASNDPYGLLTMKIRSFDEASYRYKCLLDLGVQSAFIDDRTRQQQLAKLRVERDGVSAALSASSGLGL